MSARPFLAAALAVTLAACAGSPTESRWSCTPGKGLFRSCASIGEIDTRSQPQRPDGPSVTLQSLTGGELAGAGHGATTGMPRREGDRVLRIVVAPWIDAAGDYHSRSEIYAIVQRGGWSFPVPPPPPPPVQVAGAGSAAPGGAQP